MTTDIAQAPNHDFIVFQKVSKTFDETLLVLDGLDIALKRGKISFIIGRSGEGKSVLLKHIAGILTPDQGEIYIQGLAMNQATQKQWTEVRKRMGVLFQDGALFDSMTVFENISFPIVNHGQDVSRLNARVKELLDLVGLPHALKDQYPSELSIGEKKRVGLARALALNPELLLYDEPTTSMDPFVADRIDHLILQMQQRIPNLTSVVVSHDIASILSLPEEVFLLHNGKIHFYGTPDDFKKTQDPTVRQFLAGDRDGPLSQMKVP